MAGKAILFVDHATALGGAERSLMLLLQRLGQFGWRPHLACPPGALAEAAGELSVPVHLTQLPRLRRSPRFVTDLWRSARTLAHLCRELDAAALYSNTVRATIYCALAARLARRPFIWHMRDFWLSESRPASPWLDAGAKRLLLASARGVIVNSQAVAAHLPESGKVRVVLNGIAVDQFVRAGDDGGAFRARYNLPVEAPLVGTVGRLRPWKGQERFLRVARQVIDARPETRFVIAGGEPFGAGDNFAATLQAMAARLGLQNHVVFTGQLGDVRPVLAALDLFVHAGDPEPFGLVNVEAMAMGVPVVAFAHGALPEIINQGESGALVAPGDEAAMARTIAVLLNDSARLQEMGANARERAAGYFSIERTVREVHDALHLFLRGA